MVPEKMLPFAAQVVSCPKIIQKNSIHISEWHFKVKAKTKSKGYLFFYLAIFMVMTAGSCQV